MADGFLDKVSHFYTDEINDHVTYKELGVHAREARFKDEILKMAEIEGNHAEFWKEVIESRGGEVPSRPRVRKPRLIILRFLQSVMSPVVLISMLELGEAGAFKRYHRFLHEAPLKENEKTRLREIILDELEHEKTFRRESGGPRAMHVRDFVLGMNDGLVEILGAVTGLSAVYVGRPLIVGISGLIVGVAGALSMAIGAFVSVRSQRQVNQGRKERLETLFDVAPERVLDDYRDKLNESGVPAELADSLVAKIGQNKEAVSQLLVGEIEENELRAGLFTGFAYLFAVAFPVLPYFFASGSLTALVFSVLLAGLALVAVATVISALSGIAIRRKISEMVILGFAAAGVAYLFGKIVQSTFGIEV
ncbi:MAG: VIT1/CCC1 transporter family protein [Acidiferrobacterales bacterium]|nr:VIT1/CCC1 transporter family protein [Acidiferrobacterales bacterium]